MPRGLSELVQTSGKDGPAPMVLKLNSDERNFLSPFSRLFRFTRCRACVMILHDSHREIAEHLVSCA